MGGGRDLTFFFFFLIPEVEMEKQGPPAGSRFYKEVCKGGGHPIPSPGSSEQYW